MPTTKGKSKAGKAKKASNKSRRVAPTSRAGKARGDAPGKKTKRTTGTRATGSRRQGGKLKRTEAGPVWIGSSPAPINRPAEERGDQKAGGGSGRVVIL
jgi:hypothetical protein